MSLIDEAGAKSLMTWLPSRGMEPVEATITKGEETLTLTVTKDSDLAMLKILCAQNGAKLQVNQLVQTN